MPKLSNSQLWLLWCFGGPKHELALCVLWMTFTLSQLSQGSDAHKSIWKFVFQRPPNLGRPHFDLSPASLRSTEVKHLVESSHAVQEKVQIVVGQGTTKGIMIWIHFIEVVVHYFLGWIQIMEQQRFSKWTFLRHSPIHNLPAVRIRRFSFLSYECNSSWLISCHDFKERNFQC